MIGTERDSNNSYQYEYKSSYPRLQQAVDAAFGKTVEILESDEGRLALDLVPSIRRVNNLRDTVYPLEHVQDIAFDFGSFAEKSDDPQEVVNGMKTLNDLACAYYNVAKVKIGLLANDSRTYDDSELEFMAEDLIFKQVWGYWKPKRKDTQDDANSLRASILKRLRYMELGLMDNFSFAGRRLASFDAIDNEYFGLKELDYHGNPISPKKETTRGMVRGRIVRATRNISLKQLSYLVSGFPEKDRVVILRELGYVTPWEKRKDFYQRLGIDESPAVRAACERLEKEAKSASPTIDNREFVVSLRGIVDEAEEYKAVMFKHGQVLSHTQNGTRLELLNNVQNDESQAMLTDKEQEVLQLATAKSNGKFNYTIAEIGELLGLSEAAVRANLTNIFRGFGDEKRFVNRNGEAIPRNSNIHWLIANSPYDKFQLCALTPEQRRAVDYVVTPDEDGRYATTDELRGIDNVAGLRTLRRARKALENVSNIRAIHENLLDVQGGDLVLSTHEARLIEVVVGMIDSGTSMKGKSEHGVSYSLIASQSGLPVHFVRKTLAKYVF